MSGLFGGGSNSGVGGGLPTGVKLAAAALLAHQLMKHAQAERGADDAAPTAGSNSIPKAIEAPPVGCARAGRMASANYAAVYTQLSPVVDETFCC